MNKSVLVVGNFNPDPSIYTYARSFYKTFKQLGFPTNYVDCVPHVFLENVKIINKITTPLATAIANQQVVQAVKQHRPELVFIIKGQHLAPRTIQAIKATGARVVNFYPDSPFALWNNNSTAAVLQSLPLFDCFLSWSPILTPALLASGSKHVCSFPFAYDETIYHDHTPLFHPFGAPFDNLRVSGEAKNSLLLSLSKDEAQRARKSELREQIDVCFIGTWEPAREAMLEVLITRLPNVSFAIWGNRWQEHAQSLLIKKWLKGNAVYAKQMVSIYKNTKIILNFLRDQNAGAHNMRTFEVPATKSFLLTERTDQQARVFFQENYSIACFSGIDELIEKINTYLHDSEARTIISERGFIAAQDYTLSKQLLNYVEHCPALRTRNACHDKAH